MNLNEAIDQVTTIDGYRHHRWRAEDHRGTVQCFTFWFERDGEMRDHEVRFLVLDKDTPQEVAHVYTSYLKSIQPVETPFRDAVIEAIALYQGAHPELEYYEVTSINEAVKAGVVTAYIYNSVDDNLVVEKYLLWDEEGSIKRRKVSSAS